MPSSSPPPVRKSSFGLTAVGIFFFVAACAASLAAITILLPGTFLDRAWSLNPRAHAQLAPLGPIVGIPFGFFAYALFQTCYGWFKRHRWAWRLAVAIIALQVLGDFVNAFIGSRGEALVGFAIASALLLYLLQPSVRTNFSERDAPAKDK